MKSLSDLANHVGQALKSNSPAILTGIGVSGTITTAFLASEAGYRRASDEDAPADMTTREKIERWWPLYVPAGISAVVTVGCILGAAKVSSRRAAAITAAYSITERAFSEYKDKVVDKFGETKERTVRDSIAEDRVRDTPPGKVLIATGGNVLCYEEYTGRYFESDMETLRKAENQINAKLNRELYATLTDLYHILGLGSTQYSSDLGWQAGKLMELRFSTVMSPDDRPCLAFEYNYVRPID